MKNFCVSLTSIPPRFSTLEKTIRSINDQIKKPQKIFLNIPLKYKRYPNSKYNISRLEEIFENIFRKSVINFYFRRPKKNYQKQ